MADNRTMLEILQEPTEGFGDAIVVPDILSENFEIKTGLLSLIQANQFNGFESNNPHDHIRSFNRITSTLKFRDVWNDAIKLMLFPYLLEGAAKICGWKSLEKDPRDALTIIENKSKVRYSRNKPVAFKMSTTSSGNSSSTDARIDKLTDKISNLVETFNKKMTTPATVKVVEETCVICGDARGDKGYGTTEYRKHPNPMAQTQVPIDEPVVAPKPKPTIPYPSRVTNQKLHKKDDNLALKFVEIFRNLLFELSFADALLHMPKFALMFKSLLNNKEKLFDLAMTLVNENYSAVILKKLPEKLGDPDNFLIPCDFPELDERLALADLEGYILYLEKLLNEDPSLNLPPVKTEDLKQVDATMTKPLIEEPPELKFKELPSHLEYAFLEGTDKLPVIISKKLKDEEKSGLLKVLKSHKQAIAWKISNIKGIDPRFNTHKILMKDDFKPAVQHQRRVNPKIHEVIKKEVIKLLDAGLIYPIFDSPWVSPVHYVPKKGGMTVVENEDNELIPTRYVPKVHDGHLPRYDRENDGGLYGRFLDHSALKYLLAKHDAKLRLLWWIPLLQEFDVIIRDKKGAKNLTADHLSRLKNEKSIAAIWLEKAVTPLIDPAIKGFAAASAVLKPEHLKVDKHGMSEPMSYYLID
nr:reverse transcriptase domain-containing protein [Tanacetum cinerariifolium]